jgi:CRISPR-associated endonuclease/helicase Cas3
MLSATLTTAKRAELVNAYRNSEGPLELSAAYPIITYIDDGGEVVELPADASSRPLTVAVERLEGEPYDALEEVMAGGGCVGVIVNTVRRAQEIYAALKERGEKALLIHSRFKAGYRAELEERVKGLVGKGGERPERLVVVGTQVLEQSLDIDFDALFTDICPMDLLIQRIGRLHRHREHDASRPARLGAPRVFVMENDGSKRLYGEYLLSRTRELLPESLTLPQDIPRLVNAAYDGARAEGYDKHMEKVMDKESRAKHFRLAAPDRGKPSIAGILAMAASDSESAAAASVRDGQESIEVVIISEREWIDKGGRLTEDEVMERSARLPPFFSFGSYDKGVAAAVLELEKNHGDDSGNLYLAFDEDGVAELGGYRLRYSEETGLSYERV